MSLTEISVNNLAWLKLQNNVKLVKILDVKLPKYVFQI